MQKISLPTESSIVYSPVTQLPSIDYRKKITISEANKVIQSVGDLIDNDKYKPFFFKRLYDIGATQFLNVADTARKNGKKPGRMFVTLLKDPRYSCGKV